MRAINKYKTPNYNILYQRISDYLNKNNGYYKDFKVNRITEFKELPDDVLILTEYSDQVVLKKWM